MATITAACASQRPYQAESLTVFRPARQDEVEHAGIHLLAGRLSSESEVVRVLGPRSSWLRAYATILQLRIRAGSSAVTVSRDSFKLRQPTGQELRSLSSEEVLAAVSLPGDLHWGKSDDYEPDSAMHVSSAYEALMMLGVAGLHAVIGKAVEGARAARYTESATRYGESARSDVEKKTASPREIRPGESLDLLVVFVPKAGNLPAADALTLTAEFTVDGGNWKKDLVVGLK
jgi:hypothetical protein